jgi:general secretion pathway protein J
MRMAERFKNNDGFTLIEILIASAISSIILVMIYTANKSIIANVKDMTATGEFYQNIALTTRRLNADIAQLYFAPDSKCFFKGERDTPSAPNTKISFSTINSNDMMITGSLKSVTPVSDVKTVEYYLVKDTKYEGMNFLVRRERNLFDDTGDSAAFENMLIENVVSLQFEFLRNPTDSSWEKSWDSQELNLYPVAIKTTLKIKNFRGKDENYEFITYVNMNTK